MHCTKIVLCSRYLWRLHHAFFLALRTEYRVRSGCLVLGSFFGARFRVDWTGIEGRHHPTLKAAPALLRLAHTHTCLLARDYILHQPAQGQANSNFCTASHRKHYTVSPPYTQQLQHQVVLTHAPRRHLTPTDLLGFTATESRFSVNTHKTTLSSRPLLAHRLWNEAPPPIIQVCLRHILATLATRGLKLHYQIRRLLSSTRLSPRFAPVVTPPRLLPRPSTVVTLLRRGQGLFQSIISSAHTTRQVSVAPVWRKHPQVRPCLCKMDATIKIPSQTTSKSNLTMMYP